MAGELCVKVELRRVFIRLSLLGILPFVFVTGGAGITHAVPPKVTSASPDDGDTDVDPNTSVLRIEFDQDMSNGGMSLCGSQKGQVVGKPKWKSKRVIEIPIKLAPNESYTWSINCKSFRNFRSATGDPAEIYPLNFQTGKAGGKPAGKASAAPTAAEKSAAIDELRKIIDEHYSYRDLRRSDWDKLFTEHRPALEAAPTWPKFARAAVDLLKPARDMHLVVQLGKGSPVPTFVRSIKPNIDPAQLQQQVPKLKSRNGTVSTGQFDDGIGYILINNFTKKADFDEAFAALQEFASAPGLIIDVRPNGGGSEPLAAEFAGCFVRKPAIYSKHEIRDVSQKKGFGPMKSRELKPNDKRPAIDVPVAVLMGPANMSSCESFLLMMRASPKAKLIGDRSYGSSGNPQPHDLAGGIKLLVPSWRDYLPDGTLLEGQGVAPDISVPPGENDSVDPVLDVALAHLRHK